MTTTEEPQNSSFYCEYCETQLENQEPRFERGYLFALLLSFGIATVLGNSLIIVSVLRERLLHTATNYFITSLAVADFLVGLVVMPFSAMYEAMDQMWIFGPDWCDVWNSMDVLASTASILNLCVISLDRYWAITDPMTYPYKMTEKRAAILIVLVWVCSSAISFPAIAWWRLAAKSVPPEWKCPFTEDIGYLIFSSTVSFYGPLSIMVFAYARIYKAALEHTRSLKMGAKVLSSGGPESTMRIHRGGGGSSKKSGDDSRCSIISRDQTKGNNGLSRKLLKFSKEKKAAKTLGTVMGVFIICWLPFFITNIIYGLCSDCIANPDFIIQVVTWLGWINSGMNPAIYAYCSKDFRRAFLAILCICCRNKKNRNPTKLSPKKPTSQIRTKKVSGISCFCSSRRSDSSRQNTSLIVEPETNDKKVWIKTNGNRSNETQSESSPQYLISKNRDFRSSSPHPIRKSVLARQRSSELNMYSIPPPNYRFDPKRSIEKLL